MQGRREDVRKILAVDVCGTLFDTNTTAGFVIHYHIRNGNKTRTILSRLITGRSQPLSHFMVAAGRLLRQDLHRTVILRSLRGQSRRVLRESAHTYVDSLDGYRIDEVHQLVATMQQEGWQPVLVSNSIDLVVEQIAARMDVPYVASKLAWRDDVCLGRLAIDLTGAKRQHLEHWVGTSLERIDFSVVTDNKSDADLIRNARPTVLVARGKQKHWMGNHDARIIHHAVKEI